MKQTIAIPHTVDLLILGGSSGAVSCALAARATGASVLIAAPLAGLGDDIFAHLRLHSSGELSDPLAALLFPGRRCPTPLHAKDCCEQQALAAGVDIIFGALPCGVLRDDQGQLSGAIIAHRGGRSAIAARAIVDAGRLATFARQAGVPWSSWDGGAISVETVLIGVSSEDCAGEGEDLGSLQLPRDDQGNAQASMVPWLRRRLTLPLADDSVPSLLALESACQLAAFHPQALGSADWAWYLPPTVSQAGSHCEQWESATTFPLKACASNDSALWILGPAANCSPEVAAQIADPAHLCILGRRLGALIANDLPALRSPATAVLAGEAQPFHLRGRRNGLRATNQELPTVAIDEGQLPTLASADVVVVGGGTGGAPAGISAARRGARTLVLERLHRLGGVGTLGRISRYWCGNRSGFTAEVDARIAEISNNPFPDRKGAWWALEHKQDLWLRMLNDASGTVWFGAQVCAVAMDGERVVGHLVATVHGAGLVRCTVSIDASGAAEVAAAAGAPCRVIDDHHIAVQGTGLSPVNPHQPYQNSDHDFCDDADSIDATRMLLKSRRKFAGEWDTCAIINSRERRQIQGHYELTPIDICLDRQFPDAVLRASSNFDSHGFTVHPAFLVHPMDKKQMKAWVPYRCFLPQTIDGVLVVGLGMSAHRDCLPVVRMQPDVQNAGYFMGLAAALCCEQQCTPSTLPVADLQQHLVEGGLIDSAVIGMSDSFPIDDELLATLIHERLNDLIGSAAAFGDPQRSLPLLELALADPERHERAALILGLLGHGQAAAALRSLLQPLHWDEGWHFRGMHQFGASLSPMDIRLIALAHCGEASDSSLISDLAARLEDEPALSHVRALSWAAATLAQRHPQCADTLSQDLLALLQRPGMAGHARSHISTALNSDADSINTAERQQALREIHLGAALFRLNDPAAAGQRTLEAYATDVHGHYAAHAQAVLRTAADCAPR